MRGHEWHTAIASIDPLNVLAYLAGQGWSVETRTENAVMARHSVAEGEFEVLLPLRRELRDYRIRIAQLVETLAEVENREPQAILNNLLLSADIVRLVVSDVDTENGTVSLERAPAIFDNARNLLMAAACSVIEKRPVHPNRKPPQASQFVREARMGQTERGSYVVTVAAPVPRVQTVEEAGLLFPELDVPFGRNVTTTLQSALMSAKAAAREYRASGRIETFQQSVKEGVSSNLCESLIAIGQDTTITIDIAWSRVRPPSVETGAITIGREEMPPFAAAAEYFHKLAPAEGFQLVGWVTALHRETAQQTGDVTIQGMTDTGVKSVRVALEIGDYDLAIAAHRDRRVVSCIGTLVREGNIYRLRDPQVLTLLDDTAS